jgi:hypothetical protein
MNRRWPYAATTRPSPEISQRLLNCAVQVVVVAQQHRTPISALAARATMRAQRPQPDVLFRAYSMPGWRRAEEGSAIQQPSHRP